VPTTQLNVTYRPLRLGLVTRQKSLQDFRTAVRFASCLWGGRFDPILTVAAERGRFTEAVRKLELGVRRDSESGMSTGQTALASPWRAVLEALRMGKRCPPTTG
jgi:hypothetical protein